MAVLLRYYFLPDTRGDMLSDECRKKKAFEYVKRMLPPFRAVVKFCSINRLFKLYFEYFGSVAPYCSSEVVFPLLDNRKWIIFSLQYIIQT